MCLARLNMFLSKFIANRRARRMLRNLNTDEGRPYQIIRNERAQRCLSIKELEQTREYYKEPSHSSLYTYLLTLGRNKRSMFGKRIKVFIEEIKKSRETDPVIIMAQIRTFMCNMKNLFIAYGGVNFDKEIALAMADLSKPFNLDEILENVVSELVLIPLKYHLDNLIFKEYGASVTLVMEHMYNVRSLTMNELGITSCVRPFTEDEISELTTNFYNMQTCELPSEKMKHLLIAMRNIYKFTKSSVTGRNIRICADDLILIIVWVLSQCRTFTVEVEGLYMWYLMNPKLQTGESGYYITSLLCAGTLLCDPNKFPIDRQLSPEQCFCCDSQKECNGEIKVILIDELTGLPEGSKVIPSKPYVKVKSICSVLAKKRRIKHPEFYGLYVLLNGQVKLLKDQDCPGKIQESVQRSSKKNCLFLYKEINRKLSWPFNTPI